MDKNTFKKNLQREKNNLYPLKGGAHLFEKLQKEFGKGSANHEDGWYPMLISSMTNPKVMYHNLYYHKWNFSKSCQLINQWPLKHKFSKKLKVILSFNSCIPFLHFKISYKYLTYTSLMQVLFIVISTKHKHIKKEK